MAIAKGSKRLAIDMDDALAKELENWRRAQPEIPSKAEAVRELLLRALGSAWAERNRGRTDTHGV